MRFQADPAVFPKGKMGKIKESGTEGGLHG
jgi:hypothetical protein